MLTNRKSLIHDMMIQKGFTLIELIAFMVVMGIVIVAVGTAFQHSIVRMQDPLIKHQLLSMAQSSLDETLSRRFNENTPTGGVPACGVMLNTVLIPCASAGLDAGESIMDINSLDDVDDFHGFQDIPATGFSRSIQVVSAGEDFGMNSNDAKFISVTVTSPNDQTITLSVYRFNF